MSTNNPLLHGTSSDVFSLHNSSSLSLNALRFISRDILWEEEANPEQESEDDESEDKDEYDDQLTEEQWRSLFGESDDEDEFEGF